jgi:hypothetical protein
MAEFLTSTFVMRLRNVSCSFFKGKRSGRSFEVIKGDCTNVDGDAGEGGGFVKKEGGKEGCRHQQDVCLGSGQE